jgi:predicted transcriptional regulator
MGMNGFTNPISLLWDYLLSNFAEKRRRDMTKETKDMKPLTRAESELMNRLWDHSQGLTVKQLVESYPEPQPAYTTVGTFLKILEAKGFVEHRRENGSGRTFVYSPLLTRDKYVTQVLRDVKDNIFGSSVKKMLSFFVEHEEIDEDELREIMALIHDHE